MKQASKHKAIQSFFPVLLLCHIVSLYGQDGQTGRTGLASIGKQWAVFIAIDRYDEWGTLGNPVQDAKDLRDILVGNYYIQEVRELYNEQATASAVRNLFNDLHRRIGVSDSLFVFYAGGGRVDKFTGAGSWLLMPSNQSSSQEPDMLANEEVQSMLAVLPAKHVFLVADACFLGDGLAKRQTAAPDFTNEYYHRAYNRISRQALASGAVRTGPGSAEFIKRLKTALLNAQGRYIDAENIFAQMQSAEPRSRLSILKNARQEGENLLSRGTAHQEGGSFVFFKNAFFSPMPLVPPIAPAQGVGHIAVASKISGMVMLQGVETGTRVAANSTAMLWNVPAGDAEVAVKSDEGRIVKAYRTVPVKPETAAEVFIEYSLMDTFVAIPGGSFLMGSPPEEPERNDDETQRRVSVKPFYMKIHEVSVDEFREFVQETAYQEAETGNGRVLEGTVWKVRPDASWRKPYFEQEKDHPAALVSWYDAVLYCNWRSEREGLQPAYILDEDDNVLWNEKADGYRLPTETEWEYAARGTTQTPFNTGDAITPDEANFNGTFPYNAEPDASGVYREGTVPGNAFPPNRWGLYNMHGNVWEWCWDWYKPDAEDQADPAGYFLDEYRVRRGGSWASDGRHLRSSYRSYMTPTHRYNDTGFRLARSIPEK
jgi:formylglycine-generating enzyme required for sulfatase activity